MYVSGLKLWILGLVLSVSSYAVANADLEAWMARVKDPRFECSLAAPSEKVSLPRAVWLMDVKCQGPTDAEKQKKYETIFVCPVEKSESKAPGIMTCLERYQKASWLGLSDPKLKGDRWDDEKPGDDGRTCKFVAAGKPLITFVENKEQILGFCAGAYACVPQQKNGEVKPNHFAACRSVGTEKVTKDEKTSTIYLCPPLRECLEDPLNEFVGSAIQTASKPTPHAPTKSEEPSEKTKADNKPVHLK